MICRNQIRVWSYVLIVSTVMIPSLANACSCGGSTLDNRFNSSENVFTAVVIRGESTGEMRGNSPRLKTYFKVTESFKGAIPFQHFDSHADGNTCGISLQIGIEYLFFLPNSGKIGLCSGTVQVSGGPPDGNLVGQKYVDALRSHTAGEKGLSEPWYFWESEEICRLAGSFTYEQVRFPASVRIFFRKIRPRNDIEDPGQPQFQPRYAQLNVQVLGRADLTDYPMLLRVNDDSYTARWESVRASSGSYFVRGDDVLNIVSGLASADELQMHSAHPNYGEINVRVSTSNAGSSVSEMLACIQRIEVDR